MPWRPRTGMIVVRVLVSGLSVALGIVLIGRGNVVIGVLMIGLGIGRVAMLVSWQRRRAELEQRFPNRPRRRR